MLVQSCNQSYYNAYATRLSRVEIIAKDGTNFVLHNVKSLKLWREVIFYRYPVCAHPRCPKKSFDPHHIVSRNYRKLRTIVENGVGLCRLHHNFVENLSWDTYWHFIRILLGDPLCKYLMDCAI